jgi:hypothetical protein
LNWFKFDIEKFDSTTNFSLWQVQMKIILSDLSVRVVITGWQEELENDENKEWAAMDEKIVNHSVMC